MTAPSAEGGLKRKQTRETNKVISISFSRSNRKKKDEGSNVNVGKKDLWDTRTDNDGHGGRKL